MPRSQDTHVDQELESIRNREYSSVARQPVQPTKAQRWHRFINNAGTTAVAHAPLRITGFSSRLYQVDRPNDLGAFGLTPINGRHDVPAGGKGLLTFDYPTFVEYNTAKTPAAGEQWGPVKDTWKIELDSIGFVIIGDADDGRVLVMPTGNFTFLGQFDGATTATGVAGTFSLHKLVGATWTDTLHNVTARNISGVTIAGGVSGTGDRCAGQWMPNDGQFVVSPLECS